MKASFFPFVHTFEGINETNSGHPIKGCGIKDLNAYKTSLAEDDGYLVTIVKFSGSTPEIVKNLGLCYVYPVQHANFRIVRHRGERERGFRCSMADGSGIRSCRCRLSVPLVRLAKASAITTSLFFGFPPLALILAL